MQPISKRLQARLRIIREMHEDASWKNPDAPGYDRQQAENALYRTIGPLLDNPRWAADWLSPDGAVHKAGQPAPRWTQHEVIIAMAGDPRLLFRPGRNPVEGAKAPSYGDRGGAPVFRLARRVAKKFARGNDKQFISDLYGNGLIELTKMMQPGFDEGRSPFISFTIRNIEGAMEQGVGSTNQANSVVGERSQTVTGLGGLLQAQTGDEARRYADQVKGKYRTEKHHDKHPDNPFAQYSSRYYAMAMNLADALDSGDAERVEAAKNQIRQLQDQAREETTTIPGAASGLGQAITIKDRKSGVGLQSIDKPVSGSDEQATQAGNLADPRSSSSWVGPEQIKFVLDQALNYHFGQILGPRSKFVQAVGGEVGGPLTVNEFRYVLRYLGQLGSDYPGKGKVRRNTNFPRDTASKPWWQPGEDPELEPIPGAGKIWESIWRREGCPQMGPQAIAVEMTDEFNEFQKLGIPTARKATKKEKRGQTWVEVVSKEAVNNTVNKALIKLKIAAAVNKGSLGMDENAVLRRHGIPLLEDMDPVDAAMCEATERFLIELHSRFFLEHMI